MRKKVLAFHGMKQLESSLNNMSRECSADFAQLQKYIASYGISSNQQQAAYVALSKSMHKYYFSAITWNVELSQRKVDFITIAGATEDIINRLSESVSDIGYAYFNWLHGSYKPARIMLRVAIENYIRAISAIEVPGQLTETSVYKMLDTAAVTKIFSSNNEVKKIFTDLRSTYKLLCEDAHTATNQNMAKITSLSEFPFFEKGGAKSCSTVFTAVTMNITATFCILFIRDIIYNLHSK